MDEEREKSMAGLPESTLDRLLKGIAEQTDRLESCIKTLQRKVSRVLIEDYPKDSNEVPTMPSYNTELTQNLSLLNEGLNTTITKLEYTIDRIEV